VGDEERGSARCVGLLTEKGEDARLGKKIEPGRGLVGEDDGRLKGKDAGEREALEFAAGDGVGAASEERGR
jgi:hypothetical protein